MAMPAGNTVIIGAGIIGTATAYYLSESSNTPAKSIHLIETTPELFSSASGYAGGLLAKDWFSPNLAELGALSFQLHRELAEQHRGREKWGWAWSQGSSISALGRTGDPAAWLRHGGSRAELRAQHVFGEGKGPAWLTTRQGQKVDVISEDETIAQVDPLRLCRFLMEQAKERGVNIHHPAEAVSVSTDLRGELGAVRLAKAGGEEIDTGAWTQQVFSNLFPASTIDIPISKLAGHSLVLKSPRWSKEHEELGCHAVFATDDSGFSPEIFSRLGGDIYIAGLNDYGLELPKTAADAKPDRKELDKLMKVAVKMLGLPDGSNDLDLLREGLCFRPITNKNQPVISRVDDRHLGDIQTRGGGDGGVFVAAGHGPWGISQSLGTGKVLSEMLQGLKPSADVSQLSL